MRGLTGLIMKISKLRLRGLKTTAVPVIEMAVELLPD
jgi:hypothetical protein